MTIGGHEAFAVTSKPAGYGHSRTQQRRSRQRQPEGMYMATSAEHVNTGALRLRERRGAGSPTRATATWDSSTSGPCAGSAAATQPDPGCRRISRTACSRQHRHITSNTGNHTPFVTRHAEERRQDVLRAQGGDSTRPPATLVQRTLPPNGYSPMQPGGVRSRRNGGWSWDGEHFGVRA